MRGRSSHENVHEIPGSTHMRRGRVTGGSTMAGAAVENEAFGRKVQAAMEAAGRYPYYDGGVGWPVFPER